MSLPEQILVRYAQEDAGYVSMRSVTKQTFRLEELTDMVVSAVGKDAHLVQQIFRSGTVLYNGYHYWWDSLTAEPPEIELLLAAFPDDDPSRPFEPAGVRGVLLESGGGTQRNLAEISKNEAQEKKLFAKSSAWEVLLQLAASHPPRYERYSHGRRADLFRLTLSYDRAQQLLAAIHAVAPRNLRRRWNSLLPPTTVRFVSPR